MEIVSESYLQERGMYPKGMPITVGLFSVVSIGVHLGKSIGFSPPFPYLVGELATSSPCSLQVAYICHLYRYIYILPTASCMYIWCVFIPHEVIYFLVPLGVGGEL